MKKMFCFCAGLLTQVNLSGWTESGVMHIKEKEQTE